MKKYIELFSGVDCFALAFKGLKIKPAVRVEIDPQCVKVSKQNFPDKGCEYHGDIETFKAKKYRDKIFMVVGSPPCYGHSVAGKKKGFEDERSALWTEYFRVVKEVRPKYCILENSANLRNTGLAELLEAFNKIGYNAEGSVISGYSIGAPAQRERIYIVMWRKDLPYRDPFRLWGTYSEKEETKSEWWASRRFKRSPLFKQIGKCKPTIRRAEYGLASGLYLSKRRRGEAEKIRKEISALLKEPEVQEAKKIVQEINRLRDERIKQCGNGLFNQIPRNIIKGMFPSIKG
jgi:DNA-cytosine methyltransferase